MQSRTHNFPLHANFNFDKENLLLCKNDDESAPFPAPTGMIFLDGTPMAFLDGTGMHFLGS